MIKLRGESINTYSAKMPNPLQSGSESAQMEALPPSAANDLIGPSWHLHMVVLNLKDKTL